MKLKKKTKNKMRVREKGTRNNKMPSQMKNFLLYFTRNGKKIKLFLLWNLFGTDRKDSPLIL